MTLFICSALLPNYISLNTVDIFNHDKNSKELTLISVIQRANEAVTNVFPSTFMQMKEWGKRYDIFVSQDGESDHLKIPVRACSSSCLNVIKSSHETVTWWWCDRDNSDLNHAVCCAAADTYYSHSRKPNLNSLNSWAIAIFYILLFSPLHTLFHHSE